jgi:uncharacterized protein with NRDE domain
MCLIALAHRASDRFPLVIAANRDEDYTRATHDAHFWTDAPDVLGGRDAVHGGSWLAIARSGRFAAVTNLRGAPRKSKSRGALVRDFVTGDITPREHAARIAAEAEEYAGFHLFAGIVGGELVHVTPETQSLVEAGIHAVSNAPLGERWPKMSAATEAMDIALRLDGAESIVAGLMEFLRNPRNTGSYEGEVFIAGEQYGTRASTVIVATPEEILFSEQSFASGGVAYSKNRLFRVPR